MSILYHLTIPRSPTPVLDAVVQEVRLLQAHLGGEIVYLNPAHRPGSRYPERLYGLHRLIYLRRREATARLHHIYNSHPFLFPYLRWLRRPIIYSVTAGLRPSLGHSDPRGLERLSAVVVSNERDRATLCAWGLRNVHAIRPGIDTSRFSPSAPPDGPGFVLLVGSAPWTKAQFHSKGVEALLTAAEARPDLRLVFLWRGLLYDEMQVQVAQRGLEAQVEVINQQVDVNEILTRVHAAVVLASDATLVKAFPHSLMETLTVGRPVLVSRVIPMAEYVDQTGCGIVVEQVDSQALLAALDELVVRYRQIREATLQLDHETFSIEQLEQAYTQLYRDVTEGA
jgi:glycosyltransferase involved in cell wall biosynthesis